MKKEAKLIILLLSIYFIVLFIPLVISVEECFDSDGLNYFVKGYVESEELIKEVYQGLTFLQFDEINGIAKVLSENEANIILINKSWMLVELNKTYTIPTFYGHQDVIINKINFISLNNSGNFVRLAFSKKIHDYCLGSSLIEFYCNNGIANASLYDCPYGCENGLCINENVSCFDSDLGNKVSKYGTVKIGNLEFKDECISHNILKEYYCESINSKEVSYKQYECSICNNGSCILTDPKICKKDPEIRKMNESSQANINGISIELLESGTKNSLSYVKLEVAGLPIHELTNRSMSSSLSLHFIDRIPIEVILISAFEDSAIISVSCGDKLRSDCKDIDGGDICVAGFIKEFFCVNRTNRESKIIECPYGCEVSGFYSHACTSEKPNKQCNKLDNKIKEKIIELQNNEKNVVLKEDNPIRYLDYTIIGYKENYYLIQLTSVGNDSTTGKDILEFIDVFTNEKYNADFFYSAAENIKGGAIKIGKTDYGFRIISSGVYETSHGSFLFNKSLTSPNNLIVTLSAPDQFKENPKAIFDYNCSEAETIDEITINSDKRITVGKDITIRWSKIYEVINEDLKIGYNTTLGKNERLKLELLNETHYIGVIELSSTSVTIEVLSDPQIATLSINETKKFDINNDRFYDVSVKFNGILNNNADLTIKEKNEKIKEKSKSEQFLYIGVLIILFIFIIIIFILLIKAFRRN